MKRKELETQIIKQHPQLMPTNLKYLKKHHLESWLQNGELKLSFSDLEKIFLERNKKAAMNQKLNRENFGLKAKLKSLKSLTDFSKSEVIQTFQDVFGKVSKEDNNLLKIIGAVSIESVREDLDTAEKVADKAIYIAKQYNRKYGNI